MYLMSLTDHCVPQASLASSALSIAVYCEAFQHILDGL